MQRRTFLAASSAAFVTALAKPLWAFPKTDPYLDTLGLQLWTVRNQLDEDLPKTMKAVADAGYRQVELMRTLGQEEIVRAANDNGLKITSAFIDWQSIGNPDAKGAPNFDEIVDKANELSLKYLVYGYIGKGHRERSDQFKQHAERANRAGEKCRDAGIQLCYHNHSFEFQKLENDKNGFEIFIEEFDKELVKFEVDVFWVAIGGWNPYKTLRQLKGRVAQVHLKDLLKGTEVCHDEGEVPHEAFKELGNGTINMQRVLNVSRQIGVDQCHVEQDQSPAPITSIGESIDYLRKIES